LCESYEWREWAGYLAASSYQPNHEYEYYAIRNAAALIDVSPLFKYEIRGPDAARLVNRIMTRDVSKCAIGQVMYSPWCDDAGMVIDDGTVARLDAQRFRITAADPNLLWFQDCGLGLDVTVTDVSTDLAALALQGPSSRQILKEALTGVDLDKLKYYRLAPAHLDGVPLTVSRTGYTGDLGYELWIAPEHAGLLWDRLVEHGRAYGIAPAGMVALDIARIEAGLLLTQVDYFSSRTALNEAQKTSPFEIGLGWAVDLDKGPFVGRKALLAEQARGSKWQWVGLEVHWESLEALFTAYDLGVRVAGRASRSAVPIYKGGNQVGQVTSHTFSPILNKYIGLGTVESQLASVGDQVSMEVTVEYHRLQANATLTKTPFYNPAHKRT